MLDEVELDVVAILTPQHESLIEQALLRGRHVFTEKPVSLCLSATLRLARLAEQRGLVFEVGLSRRFDRALTELIRAVPEETVSSAVFTKADGSDAAVRRRLLPDQMQTYTFSQSAGPLVPDGLTEAQLGVLKALLWSGIHLLTACWMGFRPLTAIAASSAARGAAAQCLLEGGGGQPLALTITEVAVPVFYEEVRLFGSEAVGWAAFSSPYRSPPASEVVVESSEGGTMCSHRTVCDESPFARMWSALADRLDSTAFNGFEPSIEAALEIESIALDCARLA